MAGYGDHEVSDDPLQILRHSTAHLLAAAVTELYPGVKYAIGPAIKEPPGFYYDFDFGKQVSDAELPAIESRMRRLANADIPYVHEVLPREQAIEEFRKRGQDYKLELIADKVSGDGVSVYRTGDLLVPCLGPYVRSARSSSSGPSTARTTSLCIRPSCAATANCRCASRKSATSGATNGLAPWPA